jgi:uncharacterized protein (TIGR02118 family)
MPYTVVIAYPNDIEATFNLNYYLTSHMPLVESLWGKRGLLKWELVEFESGNAPEKLFFRRANMMVWEDQATFAAASQGPIADEILGDIPNFSNRQPQILEGNVVGSG